MADWSRLTEALALVETEVTFTWDELEELVGGMPPSATNHRAWWSGDRPHVNVWRAAGFRLTHLDRGSEVSFTRIADSTAMSIRATSPTTQYAARHPETPARAAGLLLVTCVKTKLDRPAAARDLYTSPLFRKQRSYAENSGLPWFILSAEHGLVGPDEWLAPYERYLPDMPLSYRTAWGMWVSERLEMLAGPLNGRIVEIHASSSYLGALQGPLTAKGARILDPLAGLTMGERLAWYGESEASAPEGARRSTQEAAVDEALGRTCTLLMNSATALSPAALAARGATGLRTPGLYSWWVDELGADNLSKGLNISLAPGLIYAGLAGATHWPSGRPSANTLWSRITAMHLGSNHDLSTLRLTLGAILAAANGEASIDEAALTAWMYRHLRVVTVPYPDADGLGQLESDLLNRLDPPLNLRGVSSSPVRARVSELRRRYKTDR